MQGHWLISFGQQEHALLGSALCFIQITWFTYVFHRLCQLSQGAQVASLCRMQIRPSVISSFTWYFAILSG